MSAPEPVFCPIDEVEGAFLHSSQEVEYVIKTLSAPDQKEVKAFLGPTPAIAIVTESGAWFAADWDSKEALGPFAIID